MKELIFCIQFILSQEIYYTPDRVSNKIDGIFAFNSKTANLRVNKDYEEFQVVNIAYHGDKYVINFVDGDNFGTIYAFEKYIVIEMVVKSPHTHLVKVKYLVKLTNME